MLFCPICKYKLSLAKTVPDQKDTGFLCCQYCQYSTKLEQGTVILECPKVQADIGLVDFDPKAVVYDSFPRKRVDRCTNKSCPNSDEPEVIVWKDDNFNIRYVCSSCDTVVWSN